MAAQKISWTSRLRIARPRLYSYTQNMLTNRKNLIYSGNIEPRKLSCLPSGKISQNILASLHGSPRNEIAAEPAYHVGAPQHIKSYKRCSATAVWLTQKNFQDFIVVYSDIELRCSKRQNIVNPFFFRKKSEWTPDSRRKDLQFSATWRV